MIGAGMMQAASSAIDADYNVVVTPTSITETVPNGTWTSPLMIARVYNGVGPFEYSWEYSTQNFVGGLTFPNKQACQASISRFDTGVIVAVICTVTDTGNANAQTEAFCTLNITFG